MSNFRPGLAKERVARRRGYVLLPHLTVFRSREEFSRTKNAWNKSVAPFANERKGILQIGWREQLLCQLEQSGDFQAGDTGDAAGE
jgi:hypothetical protein